MPEHNWPEVGDSGYIWSGNMIAHVRCIKRSRTWRTWSMANGAWFHVNGCKHVYQTKIAVASAVLERASYRHRRSKMTDAEFCEMVRSVAAEMEAK